MVVGELPDLCAPHGRAGDLLLLQIASRARADTSPAPARARAGCGWQLAVLNMMWKGKHADVDRDTLLKMFLTGFLPGALIALVLEASVAHAAAPLVPAMALTSLAQAVLGSMLAVLCFPHSLPQALSALQPAVVRAAARAFSAPARRQPCRLPTRAQRAAVPGLGNMHHPCAYLVFLALLSYGVAGARAVARSCGPQPDSRVGAPASVEETVKLGIVRCRRFALVPSWAMTAEVRCAHAPSTSPP